MKLLIKFLEGTTGDIVPADELGAYWIPFVIFVCVICIVPWIALIVYSVFFKRYRVRYFINGECVHTDLYKKGETINLLKYSDNNINVVDWYIDADYSEKVISLTIEDSNIKLFGKVNNEN